MKKTARLKKLFFTSRQGVKPLLLIVVLLMQLLTVSQQSFAQNVTVRGKITKDDGQPLSGASVVVKGTTNGTTSNEQGNFLISAPGDATLVISSIDFTSREIKVNNQSTINVTLSSADKTLGEVIVVGYGTQRKEAITGSVASINGDKMREVP